MAQPTSTISKSPGSGAPKTAPEVTLQVDINTMATSTRPPIRAQNSISLQARPTGPARTGVASYAIDADQLEYLAIRSRALSTSAWPSIPLAFTSSIQRCTTGFSFARN